MEKIQALRELMRKYEVDAYIVTSQDEWQNEYTPSHKRRLESICGFSGSNGTLIVLPQKMILYTDSRYIAQAKVELPEAYTVLDMHKKSNCEAMKACEGYTLGYDPMILTLSEVNYYEELGRKFNFALQAIDDNLVDIISANESMKIVEISEKNASKLCSKIIAALPEYFSLPGANQGYIEGVKSKQNFAAKVDGRYVGMISIDYNQSQNANIYWLGISPDTHGMGIGSRLIKHVGNLAQQQGMKTMTVETVAPSEADENYLKTYNFYLKHDFIPLFALKPAGYENEMIYMVKTHLSAQECHMHHSSVITILSDEIAGQSVDSKIDAVVQFIPPQVDYLILTSPASICWLLNIRSNDIEYNTLLLSYAVVERKNKRVNLFANTTQHYSKVIIKPLIEFKHYLLKNKQKIFGFDTQNTAYWISCNLPNVHHMQDPTVNMRAVKNHKELEGMKLSHLYDGIAVCRFWFWLYSNLKQNAKIDEMSAALRLSEFRKLNPSFVRESFKTISSYGANSAIVHYSPSETASKAIPNSSSDYIYLLDSGGQYSCAGTTDATRVFDIGKIFGVHKYEHKKVFTLVLKGHIKLAKAIFPVGTSGGQLDAFARYHLWQNGLDYGHSTGHGVGHFLSVHEGPHGIARRNNVPLQENMIVSIEPGYYKEGSFGMRIENLYYVKKSESFEGFLEFELLTLIPIETSLVDFSLLTKDEIEWLKLHNKSTVEMMRNYLSSDEMEFILINSRITE